MRIGITVDIRHSMFSAGHPNSSIAILEVFRLGGHEVVLIRKEKDREWWTDVKELTLPCIHIDQITSLDLFIEVGWQATPIQRRAFKKSIWYCRSGSILNDIEASVYGFRSSGRDLEGIHEIWMADLYTSNDDTKYMKLLYPSIKIRIVPWLWTSTIVETYRETLQSPVWIQTNEDVPSDTKWSLRICETNDSNTSSCVIPFVILRHSYLTKQLPISTIHIHNTEILSKSKFFIDNVVNHCKLGDISANLVGRQRIIDWSSEPRSVLLTHSRFLPLKMANLEAVWVGLPIVHNNTVLRDFGRGLELLYYKDNHVVEASEVLDRVIHNTSSIPYLNSLDILTELRNLILDKFSPEAKVTEWNSLLEETIETPVRYFNILFTDMWDNFNESHNMFTLALEKHLINTCVKGYSLKSLPPGLRQDIHIFGPFGKEWLSVEGPKVHFTGENTDPIYHPSVKLNLGYKYLDDPNYVRMPLWMLEVDWFGADINEIRNPIPLPLESCISSSITERKKFCAFIVSNPMNPIRNEAFHILNTYKGVDSAGRLFNNIGEGIFAGLGGGGGEMKKHEFLKEYKFCIAYENSSSPGYTTEKLLHAKAAGCVPIYWGDPRVSEDFDPSGYINITGSPSELLNKVKQVEENEEMWNQMASVPAISAEKREYVLETFTKMCTKILELNPLFVTASTDIFWPSLIRWLNSIKKFNGKARVYVGSDVSDYKLEKITKEFSFATFIRFPVNVPDGFADFWNPKHYAWKIWIYYTLSRDPLLNNTLIFYTDCGSVLIRWPAEWIHEAMKNKISFLNDSTQINRHWCHEQFCKALYVTEEEKESNQIAACLVLFVSGDLRVIDFFSEAYRLACIKDIIVGEKWTGVDINNHPIGHRHDQSILSILSKRYKLDRYPLEKIYNHKSVRDTYYNGQYIYVHRDKYITHEPLLEGIDDAYVINLDRRQDRRKAFLEYHPYLKGKVRRHVAIDGRTIQLTPLLARLFKPNDFFWKKAVMGCALSHLKLWTMLVNDSSEIGSYLIMEDDARLAPGWKDAWKTVYPRLPVGWDCIYLGGILPPNKDGFKTVLEPILPGLSRIALNRIFGQSVPTRYFHFCAYAYVLSRSGAKKILDSIHKNSGYWTSADHMICNEVDTMNLYVMDPLVAGASQDDDPVYKNAEFNNFHRVDTFDSDLWNNDERFSQDEISINLTKTNTLDILGALNDSMRPAQKMKFVSLDIDISDLYEKKWLEEVFGSDFSIESVNPRRSLEEYSNLCVVIMKPNWDSQLEWLERLRSYRTFSIFHFSDEFVNDPVFFYEWPEVRKILRFYNRREIENNPKVTIFPLGYHWPTILRKDNTRKYIWSFIGTNWNNRETYINPLRSIVPHYVQTFSSWNHTDQLKEDEYRELLLNSQFVPCPRGNNIETFRLYEALESGCIPICVDVPEILSECSIVKLNSWSEAPGFIDVLMKNPEKMEAYRSELFTRWNLYKDKIKLNIQQFTR